MPAIRLKDYALLDEARLEDKKAKGRYTLAEAAAELARNGDVSETRVLEKLCEAAYAGGLRVYEPGKTDQYRYRPEPAQPRGRARTEEPVSNGDTFHASHYHLGVRSYYEEAYWSDLNEWLQANEPRITWRFADPEQSAEAVATPDSATSAASAPINTRGKPAQRAQEDGILQAIRKLGYDPEKLPKRTPGKPWVKAEVRKRLKLTVGVFDGAWERLRADGRIHEKS